MSRLNLPKLTPPTPEQIEAAERWEAETRAKAMEEAAARIDQFSAVMGERYANCMVRNYVATTKQQIAVRDRVKAYCYALTANMDEGKGLVLCGSVGTGKDHLASAILREACRLILKRYETEYDEYHSRNRITPPRIETVRAIGGRALEDRVKATYSSGRGEETVADIVSSLSACRLLLLSDPVTRQNDDKRLLDALFRIIDQRYSHVLPTLMTINATDKNDLKAKLGERIVDRLHETAEILSCFWPSHRAKGA